MMAYITDLAEYVGGQLIGEWVAFPVDDLDETLQGILTQPDHEYFLTDWEGFPFQVGEYSSLQKINEQAREYGELQEYEQEAFRAIYEATGQAFDEIITIVKNGCFQYLLRGREYGGRRDGAIRGSSPGSAGVFPELCRFRCYWSRSKM